MSKPYNKMKNYYLFLLPCLAIAIPQSCNQFKQYTIRNAGGEDVIDSAVVMARADVITHMDDTATTAPFILVKSESGELLPSQCDDMDGDGKWDELAILCDLEAGEIKIITFEVSDTQPRFPVRTNIRFGRMVKPFEDVTGDLRMKTNDTKYTAPVYQMEGPAWENDRIAFRNYYDARNGIDIFGKTTVNMVMDSVGVNGREYHTLADWGMDILKVGNSLGAGAIAIGIGDSLYRVGPCDEGKYRLVAEGPVRAILELTYKNVPAATRLYQVTHQITIYAGGRSYWSKVWVNNLQGDEELVTGIVNLHNIQADSFATGNKKILYALGNQGFSDELLGMGLIVPADQLVRYCEAPATGNGIVSTHLASIKLNNESPSEYRFMAAWENSDPQIKDKDYFVRLLQAEAIK